MRRLWLLLSPIVMIAACEVKPQEINYGSDACSFCKMTIVDTKHAAEIVTEKGKAYKYDAIECMLNHIHGWDGTEIELHLVTDFRNPGQLIDAKQAHYLISESIPSPMGANLSAFQDKAMSDNAFRVNGGEQLSWNELKKEFSR